MDNPYANAGTFVGRQWELGRLTRFVSRGESCLVVGGRRAGKTMLLDQLDAPRVGRPVFRSDVGGWPLHDERSALRELGRALGVEVSDRDGLHCALDDRAPLCLVLDEADRMLREPWAGSLLAWMRSLIGTRGLYTELAVVLAGGPRLLGYEHPDEPGSPALNISKRILLRPFGRDDVEQLVALGSLDVDVDELERQGGGHPWLLNQMLCEIFDGTSLDEAVEEALDQCHDSFPVWARQLGGLGTAFVGSIPGEGVDSVSLEAHARDGARVARYLCLVRNSGDGAHLRYLPGPRLFSDWLAKRPPPTPWDLAISYASEDEAIAASIKRGLHDEFRVFFAPDEQAWMWGEELSKALPKLYGAESRYVLVLSTAAYCKKHWTRAEFESARQRTGTLLVVDLGELPADLPSDIVVRRDSGPEMVGLLDDLRTRLRSR